ncbi:MAG: DUF4158 domain-containing protein [Pseudomonadales bacterium]|nr:DUF4158 domain-containing protein [Pseudomonadales bacterium]
MSSTHAIILTDNEQVQLYAQPLFAPREQTVFFTLSNEEQQACDRLEGTFQKVHFILLLGYFKAKKTRLELTWGQVKEDLRYLYQRYYPEAPQYRKNLSNRVRLKLYRIIFQLKEYSICTHHWHQQLKQRLSEIAKNFMNKRHLFDETLRFLEQYQLEIPAYSTLQIIVSGVSHTIEKRLEKDTKCNLRNLSKLYLASPCYSQSF